MDNEERLDWGQFGSALTPEDEKALEDQQWRSTERSALLMYKDDYRWIRHCAWLPLEELRDKIIADGPWSIGEGSVRDDPPASEQDREHCLRRYRQAQIVLESRDPGYNPLADSISRREGKEKGNS